MRARKEEEEEEVDVLPFCICFLLHRFCSLLYPTPEITTSAPLLVERLPIDTSNVRTKNSSRGLPSALSNAPLPRSKAKAHCERRGSLGETAAAALAGAGAGAGAAVVVAAAEASSPRASRGGGGASETGCVIRERSERKRCVEEKKKKKK